MNELIVIGILGLTDACLLFGLYLYSKENGKERAKLINALIAKNATELRDIQMSEREPEVTKEPIEPFVSLDNLDEKEFDKFVIGENESN